MMIRERERLRDGGAAPFFWTEVISARPSEGVVKMTQAKKLAANGATLKESTHSRTDGGKSPLAKLPDAAHSSAPE